MKAVRIHEYGDASVLRYEDAPVPAIGADELLIRVTAAGVNPADYKIRSGYMGADEVIDYTAGDFALEVRDADLVLDTVGGEVQKRSFGVLRRGGLLISIVGPPDETLAAEHGVTARFERASVTGPRLAEIGGLIDAGKVRITVEKEFPLREARAAHELVETGRVRGKVLLRVS